MKKRSQQQPTVIFFWDYDTQWGADRSRAPGGPKDWGHAEFENTESLLDLHADFDIPACFAVVGAVARPGQRPYHDPRQVRQIHEAGHEVASHSFQHEWLPALGPDALHETLRKSKESLEDCIGAEVTSFVPPFNQPFDYPAGMSFSISERRQCGKERTDLRRLCVALKENGYTFCRVGYRPFHVKLAQRALRRRIDRPGRLKRIGGITCLNTNAGNYSPFAFRMLDRVVQEGGILVVYGHPHTLHRDEPRVSFAGLTRYMEKVTEYRREHELRCVVPRDLVPSKVA